MLVGSGGLYICSAARCDDRTADWRTVMTNESDESELRERARKRVEDVVGFWVHALIFAVVNVGIWIIDAAQGDGIEWAYWTTIPWGIGLAIHAVVLIAELRIFGDSWRERKIREYMDRERRAHP